MGLFSQKERGAQSPANMKVSMGPIPSFFVYEIHVLIGQLMPVKSYKIWLLILDSRALQTLKG